MIALQLIQQGVPFQPNYPIPCRLCLSCLHLNPAHLTFCEFGCRYIGDMASTTEKEFAKLGGITVCPTCETHYYSLARICKKCQTPLLFETTPRLPRPCNPQGTLCPNCNQMVNSAAYFCVFCGSLLELTFQYVDRPIIPITLRFGSIYHLPNSSINCGGLIDSGAAKNMFHISLANILGVDLSNKAVEAFVGIDPNAVLLGYQVCLEIGIANKFYETIVYFAQGFGSTGIGLLGQIGFFDRFKVHLDKWNKRITLQEGDALVDKRYNTCPACKCEVIYHNGLPSDYCWFCGTSLKALKTLWGHLGAAFPLPLQGQ